MTDITELALRLKLEAHRAVSNFNPQMNIKTRDLKELVEALERKEEQRANWFQMAQKLGEDLDSADKRIAELESRTVKLPPELYTIGELIRTQDNRITDQPMF
ncbi:hypothetical protein, partial [Klebsiella pneumoniae]|uniref:hypothetical protein n=1 Tax=Klebsiella pneumoniae TaxID=573 RepID=UPI0038BD3224